MTGGRKRGCYFGVGKPEEVLCITEGFATGMSIREASGHAIAVAFDAGNLMSVAKALREKFPTLLLVLCADDDYATLGNPGLNKAQEAAQVVGGCVAVPDFGADRPEGATDFNDLHQAQGPDAVICCIETAIKLHATATKEVPQLSEAVQCLPISVEKSENHPLSKSSLSCEYGDGRFEVSARGLIFIGTDKDGREKAPLWLCSLLYVVAKTRDAKSGEWGRLLKWQDDDGVQHQWAMPIELLEGDGLDVRRELARRGLQVSPNKAARDLIAAYLKVWSVETRARCVDRLGWHENVYLTPSYTIGETEEHVVFQNTHAIEPALAVSGTAEEWREGIASLARGNTRLVFALSIAFAGTLAHLVDEDSGGFHLRGLSSSGKSTALKMAASVWGKPSTYVRLWRATANGLEGLAALHNDNLLILDELSQIDPKEAGQAAYLLANGQGKARAARNGTARAAQRWRLMFLSAGEESLSALMARAGKKTNAGQEIRLADLEIDAGAGMGAFEQLHHYDTPGALALAIKEATTKLYGEVGLAWLKRIVSDQLSLTRFIRDGIQQFMAEVLPAQAVGQIERVARRFALVAIAGELASHYGLTGWPEHEAERAAKTCFMTWFAAFGAIGNREESTLLAQIRAFFETHGSSRFEDVNALSEQRIFQRAGFCRARAEGGREFLVLPEVFKRELCAGYDLKIAERILLARGWLAPGGDRTTQKIRLPGIETPTRVYVFTSNMWEAEE
ncbi:putative inner membrane protein [bacterium endosymbiont of Mortierella elongata FMR23-6]|nr:putative inner membrane protein [bacterium endosymbiont of Mortierella elongata FMR23-6]